MKNHPGITFMKEHDGLTWIKEQRRKSRSKYIPTDPKLKDARIGGQWGKTPGLIHGNKKRS